MLNDFMCSVSSEYVRLNTTQLDVPICNNTFFNTGIHLRFQFKLLKVIKRVMNTR